MNPTTCLAILTALALMALPALADQLDNDLQHLNIVRETLSPFYYLPEAVAGATGSMTLPESGEAVVRMATYHVNEAQFPSYAVLTWASTQNGLLEPCALVKTGISAKRRYDFFLAPVALSNGAAGFGIMRVSW